MVRITNEQLLVFYKKIIDATGGKYGIREQSLIESALDNAHATFDGQELYSGSLKKVIAITYALINNHGFVDGNKRIGIVVMLLLLRLNAIHLTYDQSELVEFGVKIAAGEYNREDIEQWLLQHKE